MNIGTDNILMALITSSSIIHLFSPFIQNWILQLFTVHFTYHLSQAFMLPFSVVAYSIIVVTVHSCSYDKVCNSNYHADMITCNVMICKLNSEQFLLNCE